MSEAGWFSGFIGCFKPMWMFIGKTGKQQEIEKGNKSSHLQIYVQPKYFR